MEVDFLRNKVGLFHAICLGLTFRLVYIQFAPLFSMASILPQLTWWVQRA